MAQEDDEPKALPQPVVPPKKLATVEPRGTPRTRFAIRMDADPSGLTPDPDDLMPEMVSALLQAARTIDSAWYYVVWTSFGGGVEVWQPSDWGIEGGKPTPERIEVQAATELSANDEVARLLAQVSERSGSGSALQPKIRVEWRQLVTPSGLQLPQAFGPSPTYRLVAPDSSLSDALVSLDWEAYDEYGDEDTAAARSVANSSYDLYPDARPAPIRST